MVLEIHNYHWPNSSANADNLGGWHLPIIRVNYDDQDMQAMKSKRGKQDHILSIGIGHHNCFKT